VSSSCNKEIVRNIWRYMIKSNSSRPTRPHYGAVIVAHATLRANLREYCASEFKRVRETTIARRRYATRSAVHRIWKLVLASVRATVLTSACVTWQPETSSVTPDWRRYGDGLGLFHSIFHSIRITPYRVQATLNIQSSPKMRTHCIFRSNFVKSTD